MIYLTILSLGSFSGAFFMLYKKIELVAPHVEYAGDHAHTNFIADFFRTVKNWTKETLNDIYLKIRPHAHDLVSLIFSKMYKISSWFAQEFLKFYNFIQGRKILKNAGSTSVFIRDIAVVKEQEVEGVTSVRKVYRTRKAQVRDLPL
jgi:hypothetical protein